MALGRSALCCALLFLAFFSKAQQLRFKHITSQDGLSSDIVRAILKDDKGFMWFGTQDGLNKYDGSSLRTFLCDSGLTALLSNDIQCLLQLKPDLILAGTMYGVVAFNPFTEKFVDLPALTLLRGKKINALLQGKPGELFVAADAGLYWTDLSPKPMRKLTFDRDDLPVLCLGKVDDQIYAGTEKQGLWVLGNDLRLLRASIAIPEFMKYPQELVSTITCIQHYGTTIYLGTRSYGVIKVDRNLEVQAQISLQSSGHNDQVNAIVTLDNRLFAATSHGLFASHLISGRSFTYLSQPHATAINSSLCNAVFADDQKNLWVGTYLGGVNVAFRGFSRFPLSGLNLETRFTQVHAVMELDSTTLMLGGEGFLVEQNLESGETFDRSQMIGKADVHCLIQENTDVTWVGTWGGGLIRLDRKTGKTVVLTVGESGDITSLMLDGNSLIAGTVSQGLYKIALSNYSVSSINGDPILQHATVNTLFKNNANELWVGTYNGLMKTKYNGPGNAYVERVFTAKEGLPSNVIYDLVPDRKGALWIAASGGVIRFDGKSQFKTYTNSQGLFANHIYRLLSDSSGNFWALTNNGLFRFDPFENQNEILFRQYTMRDGLVNHNFNGGAACFGQSGKLYVAGPLGFNVFRSGSVRDNLHPPPVYVTALRRSGKLVSTDSSMVYQRHLLLHHEDNDVQFELAALDFTDPGKNSFRYMLEGYDTTWSEPTRLRQISYTNLPGGDYVFKLMAANSDGVWNNVPYTIRLTVVAPFWNTLVFYLLCALALASGVYIFTQYRLRSVKAENQRLEQKVAERTRELELRNRDITSSIEYAKRIQEAILPARDQIFNTLKKVFIVYQPKDIVSGDFYWFAERDGYKVFAVADCTGHGVPGAFMSMIGHNLLYRIVQEKGVIDPAMILTHLHQGVQTALHQRELSAQSNDGMDVSIIVINDTLRDVRWAGANRPLVMIDADGKLTKIAGNKFPIGGDQVEGERLFTTQIIQVDKATMAYLFTDGFADQFGGDEGKKFMVRRFHDLLSHVHRLPPEQQQQAIEGQFDQWKRNQEQVDDVLIVGIEV